MKILKHIYYLALISFSIVIANYLWPLIKFSTDENQIISIYSQNNYHTLNDIVRYLTFICIPIIFHLLFKIYYEKLSLYTLLNNLKVLEPNNKSSININNYFFLILFVLILEFFSIPFKINEIDIFHDGQRLSSALKSSLDGSLWSGSYVSVGIIYETLGTKFIWEILDKKTIGSMKFLDLVYFFVTKLLLVYLVFLITNNLKFNKNYKLLFFIITSFVFLSINNYAIGNTDAISFREIPILLCLIFFLKSIYFKKKIYFFFIGFLSLFVFFWSIDRGIVLTIFILFIFFILAISNKKKEILILLFSILFFWLIFYLFLNYEFSYFIENSYRIFKETGSFGGIIHPIPFTDEKNSARATKNLLSIILILIISTNFFLKKNNKYPYEFKIMLLSISILCFLSYIYALARSDGPHLKQTFAFPLMFFTLYITYNLIYYLSKKQIKFLVKNLSIYIFPISILIFILFLNIDIKNIYNYKKRFINYISLNDKNFLSKKDADFINLASNIVKDEKCLQLFTNDAALLYLLKKPSCSKYYFIYSLGSSINQKKMIDEIKNTNIIISNGKTDNWDLPIKIKYPLVDKYINENYRVLKDIDGRLIKVRNN